MRLSNKQIKQLHMLREFRQKQPTTLWFFQLNIRRHIYIGILALSAICFYQWAGWPIASAFFAGILFAIFMRDFQFYRQFVKGWKLSNEITDWTKVEELLVNNQATSP
jgi:hypothetical protein